MRQGEKMSAAQEIPVLVGVGQVLQRLEDPRQAAEPLSMMVAALERAGQDAGAPKLLQGADSIYAVRGAWGYGDAGRVVASRLGAAPDETIGTPFGGNFAQACVIDAAREIQAGRRRVVLVTGAENGRSAGQAQRQGLELRETEAPGAPDRMVAADLPIFHDAELARGMNSASDIFAIIDSAIRHARGESLEAHAQRISELWAGFNEVAGSNPNAWIRKPHSAREIRLASPDNPMISYPYTRLMNANARVDMAAGPEYFHRSPAIRISGGRVLELAGKTIEGIDHLDLYSCFPSSVQVAATELGVPEGRPLSVTGGLTFGGGPLNSYTLHAIARMAEVVREDRGSRGLVHGNGGWLAKQAFAVYSAEPPTDGFRYENLQEQMDAFPLREALVDWDGPVTIEAYTVAHRKGAPHTGHAACLTDDGRRTWGTLEAPAVLGAMMREEFCGRRGRIDGKGKLSVG
jgi:acetyl-CoA C-acetyltransferase